jgi:zinc transporter ZupT
VVLHNLPVGIAVWFLLAPAFGARLALAVFAVMVGGTVTGFVAGPEMLAVLEAPAVAGFQALLAGSILHVVLHGAAAGHRHGPGLAHVHQHDEATGAGAPRWVERLGMLAGLGLLAAWL